MENFRYRVRFEFGKNRENAWHFSVSDRFFRLARVKYSASYEQSFLLKQRVIESGSLKNYSDNDINTIAEFWRISFRKVKFPFLINSAEGRLYFRGSSVLSSLDRNKKQVLRVRKPRYGIRIYN
jgi:hypothetical protein